MAKKPLRRTAKAEPGSRMWWIGFWATVWWAISGLYVVLLFWLAKGVYINQINVIDSGDEFGGWMTAVSAAYHDSSSLQGLLLFIMLIWLIGGCFWLLELKRQRVSYASALRELFFTIR